MSYGTTAGVQALSVRRGTYTSTTQPTLTQVQGFLDDIGDEIDTVLAAQGLIIPVIAPASFVNNLARLNELGAAAMTELTSRPESGGIGSSPQGERYWRMYKQGLDALKDGSELNTDAAIAASDPIARTYLTDNPDNPGTDTTDGVTAGQQPVFTMGGTNPGTHGKDF